MLFFFAALIACVFAMDKNEILQKHATERARFGVAPLTWDDKLAQVAAGYAQRCNWEHNSGRSTDYANVGGSGYVGENIAAAAGQSVGIDGWIDERNDWNCASNSCNGVCGHYTQMVWASTTRVGCAEVRCTRGSPFSGFSTWNYLVCDYAPGGNSGGRAVPSCSGGGGSSPLPVPVPISRPRPQPVSSPRPVFVPRSSPRPSGGSGGSGGSCSDTPSPRVTITGTRNLAPCDMVVDFNFCSYAPLPYCAKSCHGCSGTSSATTTDQVDENSGSDSDGSSTTTVTVGETSESIPGWGVGLLVLGSILVTLLIVAIALLLTKKPSSERF